MTTTTEARAWAVPDAILRLPVGTDREKWLAARRTGLGGSDASTVAGVNRFSSRYELWLDKTGRLPEQDETPAMRMGRALEPVVRDLFTEDTGIKVRRAGQYVSREHPHLFVDVDGLTEDGGIFEAKTTNWRMAEEWDDDQVADHAEVQVQHGLMVTGRSHAWVSVLIDGRDFRFRRVERDDALIATLVAMETRFWLDNIVADVAPAMEARSLDVVKNRYALIDLETAVAPDPRAIRDLIVQQQTAKATLKAAQENVDRLDAALIAAIGEAEALTDGERVLMTRKANGTFAAARFEAAHPDVAAQYMTKPSLDLARLQAEQPELYAQFRARVLRPTKEK